jgi:sterol desaturase/sphingolipid hydroxylase (fatty acid hydroxylase superfamily)
MTAYLYPISLAAMSGLMILLERFFPWRPEQKQLRPKLWSDLIHLVFNGHFLGVLLAGLAGTWVLPYVDRWLGAEGLTDAVYRNAAADWPLWAQIIVALVVVDFMQWCVHNLLHRIPLFWEFHKAHHSVKDEEMDWIVSFRFSWLEVIVYKSVLYLPLVFFGFRWEALMFHAIFGTLIGHLNHANLNLGHGPWRYILNSPRMHIWHHDYEGDAKTTVNFGIIFSSWDWIFGTAKMPADPPPHLGFAGVETFPDNFFSQEIWPLERLWPGLHSKVAWSVIGALVMAGAWYLHEPRGAHPETPMLGENAAASQPTGVFPPSDAYSSSPVEAEQAIRRFGEQARADGYAHAEAMVSVAELAKALGAPSTCALRTASNSGTSRVRAGSSAGTIRAAIRSPAFREHRPSSSNSCVAVAFRRGARWCSTATAGLNRIGCGGHCAWWPTSTRASSMAGSKAGRRGVIMWLAAMAWRSPRAMSAWARQHRLPSSAGRKFQPSSRSTPARSCSTRAARSSSTVANSTVRRRALAASPALCTSTGWTCCATRMRITG